MLRLTDYSFLDGFMGFIASDLSLVFGCEAVFALFVHWMARAGPLGVRSPISVRHQNFLSNNHGRLEEHVLTHSMV